MKQLLEVVKVRDELKKELAIFEESRGIMMANGWSKLNSEEKNQYSNIRMITTKLQVQINTLTYVINYDSELQDVTELPRLMTRN